MYNTYQVAGHRFRVSGECLCKAVESIGGFDPFLADNEGDVLFSFAKGSEVPEMKQVQYELAYEGVNGKFGKTEHGFLLTLKPQE